MNRPRIDYEVLFPVVLLLWVCVLAVWVELAIASPDDPSVELRVPAEVVSVLDGDTFHAIARPWPDIEIRVSVRVHGIDTPEKTWRARCDRERALGSVATAWAKKRLEPGTVVEIRSVELGKYAGRVLAGVRLPDGRDYAEAIVEDGLAVAYDGGRKPSWCEETER